VTVPLVNCLLRDEYQYDMDAAHRGEYTECMIVSASSIEGRPMLFQVLTNQGVLRDHLPITALCWKACEPMSLDDANLWSCFSYEAVAAVIPYLSNLRVRVLLKDRSIKHGTYQFTFDWYGNEAAESPGESGHKSGHFIALDDGNYVIQPNNRILWSEPSFVTRPIDPNNMPPFKTNTRKWLTERGGKWEHTEDNDDFWCHWKGERQPCG
jgi:hypothetical protein